MSWYIKESKKENISHGGLEGKRKNAGPYNERTLFRKLLESFVWFTVLKLLPLERISKLLTEVVIPSLRFKSLRIRYEFVRNKITKKFTA